MFGCRTSIRPTPIYGSEVWILKEDTNIKLNIFQRKVLRKTFGPVQKKAYEDTTAKYVKYTRTSVKGLFQNLKIVMDWTCGQDFRRVRRSRRR